MKKLILCLFLFLIPAVAHAATWAQFAIGGGYQAVLIVSNKTAVQWNGTVSLYQGYNAKWAGSWAVNGTDFTGQQGGAFSVPPYGTYKMVITGDATTRVGYMDLVDTYPSDILDVSYSFFYERRNNGDLVETVGGAESAWGNKFVFPVERSAKVDTGYALCSSSRYGTTPFFVVLTLYNQDGTIFEQLLKTYSGQQAILFSQVFTDLPSGFLGFLKVDSTDYIYMTVVRQENNSTGVQFTSVVPDTYVLF